MTSTRDVFAARPALSAAARWSPDDESLSSSERSLAVVVGSLLAEFDGLDGAQQRAVVEALETVAGATADAEAAGRRRLGLA